jgi:tetratricopeptide (TPR) repeat protein
MSEPLYAQQLTHDATVRLCTDKIGELTAGLDSGSRNEIRQLYQQALALAPTDNFLHQNFAQFLGAMGDLAQATSEAQHVCELLPQRPAQYYDIGNLLIIQGRIDDAEESYSRALALQKNFAPALNGLGQIRENEQKIGEAAACFKQALRANPDDPQTEFLLGFLEQSRGNPKQASLYYQNAARLQPQGLADYFSQAVDSSALGFRDRAIAAFGTVLQLDPACWQAHYLLGLEWLAGGKFEEAQAQFSAAVRYRPDFAPAHLNLGILLAKQEKTDQALIEFRDVLLLDPTNSAAQQYLETLHPSKDRNPGGASKP